MTKQRKKMSAGAVRRAVKVVRATVPAGNASMQGLGAQLGQHGFKVIDFCKQFNERTAAYAKDTPITCAISLYKDRSFDFVAGTPKTAHLIKLAAQGTDPLGGTPDAYAAYIKSELVRWSKIVKDSGAKAE